VRPMTGTALPTGGASIAFSMRESRRASGMKPSASIAPSTGKSQPRTTRSLAEVQEVLDVAALVARQRDALRVFLHGRVGHLLDRAVVAEVDDLAAARLEKAAHDVDRRIVAVEERGGTDDPDRVLRQVRRAHRDADLPTFSGLSRHTREPTQGDGIQDFRSFVLSPPRRRAMKGLLKTVGILVLTLVVAGAITAGAMIQWSRASLDRVYDVDGVDLTLPTDPAAIEDGHRMFQAYGCAECHAADGGGRELLTEGPGYIAPPNITVIATSWPVASFELAIRHGVTTSGRPFILMPSHEYWAMDDESTARIIAYIRTLPPVDRSNPPSEVFLLGHFLHALDVFPLVPAERIDHDRRRPPLGARGTLEFGQWLGHMCTGCHGERLSGGVIPGTDPAVLGTPRNITPGAGGIGEWSEDDFRAAIREGRTPDGGTLDQRFMPWESAYSHLTDDELHSLWLYLQSVPPMPEGNR
jgi:mono/diheme cytochrome c family protein